MNTICEWTSQFEIMTRTSRGGGQDEVFEFIHLETELRDVRGVFRSPFLIRGPDCMVMKQPEPQKLGVFISYSHQNTAQKETLRSKLENTGLYEVRFDVGKEKLAEDLYKEISHNLNWADVIVPILTPEWLTSHECRDELVRAHERRRRIIPFRRTDLTDESLPHYLKKSLYVKWEDRSIETATLELIEKLKSVHIERWKTECHRAIRSLGDYVQRAEEIPLWKTTLSKRVVGSLHDQLKMVLEDSQCSFEISADSTYLNLADPLFGSAESIIAICIAEISSFWTNPDFRAKAFNYLGRQKTSANSISRLFVFQSADEANGYKNILEAHQSNYGSRPNSGVFFCSAESYKKLLSQWDYKDQPDSYKQDFGILSFGEDALPVHAVLNHKEFRFKQFKPDDVTSATNVLVIDQFRQLRTLKGGECSDELGIARWSTRLYEDQEELAGAFLKIFGTRGGHVSHHVVLRPIDGVEGFEHYLYDLAARFYSQREKLRILDVCVERRISEHRPMDGRYKGAVNTATEFEFVLRLEFETQEALAYYYSHQVHSVERENLYIRLNPAIKTAFDELNQLPVTDFQGRQKAFEAIEAAMSGGHFIRRYDVVDDEPFLSIVKRAGVPFGTFKK